MEIGSTNFVRGSGFYKTQEALRILGINTFRPPPRNLKEFRQRKLTPVFWQRTDLQYVLVDAKLNYRRLCQEHHPDRGGDQETMILINNAWAYVEISFARKGFKLD